jgi:DNA-binding SARP family transcriptional activator
VTIRASLLGPLDLTVDGSPRTPTATKQRALLALLLLARGRTVSLDGIVQGLWEEAPPPTATKAVQTYVSQLRRLAGSDAVQHRSPGYVLAIEPDGLDLDRFERLVGEAAAAREKGDRAASARLLREALALWRGPALEEFGDLPFAREWAPRLEERRLEALETRIDDDLALGQQRGLVAELEQLVDRFPYREGLRARLMLALYREGRQTDALDVYRRARDLLVEELGLEPSRELQELEKAILRHDDALSLTVAPPAAASVSPAPSSPSPKPPPLKSPALWIAIALAVGLLGVVLAVVLTRSGSNHPGSIQSTPTDAPSLAAGSPSGARLTRSRSRQLQDHNPAGAGSARDRRAQPSKPARRDRSAECPRKPSGALGG